MSSIPKLNKPQILKLLALPILTILQFFRLEGSFPRPIQVIEHYLVALLPIAYEVPLPVINKHRESILHQLRQVRRRVLQPVHPRNTLLHCTIRTLPALLLIAESPCYLWIIQKRAEVVRVLEVSSQVDIVLIKQFFTG